jgi:hypothetical protein
VLTDATAIGGAGCWVTPFDVLIKEAVEQEEIGNDKGTSKKLELLLSGRLPTLN